MRGRPIVRAALLLPFSSPSPAVREEATSLLAAAELALFEQADRTFLLMPKDSGTSAEQAASAARAALEDGADIILGPLFSTSVAAVSPLTRASGVPMVAFSTDSDVAGTGVYLLSFVPEEEVNRIVGFAGRSGISHVVLLLPEGEYGDRVQKAAQTEANRLGMSVMGVERFARTPEGLVSPSQRAAALAARGPAGRTAVLIPERGNLLRAIAQPLSQAGASQPRVRYLGTGLWAEAETNADPRLIGGWYAAPDPETRDSFEQRFQATYDRQPTRLAGMGYDATALAARQTRGGRKEGVATDALEVTDGFMGVDGLFRFSQNGVAQRGLAIMEVAPRDAKQISPAPKDFLKPSP